MKGDEEEHAPDYEVGYGKPPKSGQFVKGKSGNPRGRPRRKFRPKLSQASDRPTTMMILDEAYRVVRIKEGDKTSKMPVNQAVTRALGVSAMKGNIRAQRLLIALVNEIENELNRQQRENLENAIETKFAWDEACARWDAKGIPRPEPLPHPEDLVIDLRKGEARLEGPCTPEEKEALDTVLKHRDRIHELIDFLTKRMKQWPRRRIFKETILKSQRKFDELNDLVPNRYRTTLRNRLDGSDQFRISPPAIPTPPKRC